MQAHQRGPANIYDASLDQLMNVRVTSVSKKEQSLSKVAAAIYVITSEEIRRSGAANVPDLLRMVPGLDVGQINAHVWAISARGFSSQFANKLLVLIDGRSVYSLTFSGVLWDEQEVPLADIERIEVIRGPGATVWGANAVNGVIDIITKNSKQTQGGLVEVSAGSTLVGQGVLQYGGPVGGVGHYRVFATSSDYRANADATGKSGGDPWHTFHGGFRSDWDFSDRDTLTVQGDIASNNDSLVYQGFLPGSISRGVFNDTTAFHGGNILGRWTRKLSPHSDIVLQTYFDRNSTLIYGSRLNLDTIDFDFQHHVALGTRHDVVWGVGFRAIPGSLLSGYSLRSVPESHTNTLASAFVQDEIALSKSFWLTLGTKFDRNDYTGIGVQPSIRALWSPNRRHSVWGAVSEALREPSRENVGIELNLSSFPGRPEDGGLTNLVTLFGDASFRAEKLTAYETGYRYEPNHRVSLDLATFFNQYRDLASVEPGGPFLSGDPAPLHVVFPQFFSNKMSGNAYGAEFSANVNVNTRWKLSPGYSWLRMNLHPNADSLDATPEGVQGDGPEHQFQIRAYLTLPHNFDLDAAAYYVSGLADQNTPGYTRMDARLARKLGETVELSLVGQNLSDNRHLEFNARDASVSTLVRRSVYAKLSWRF